MVHAKSGDKFVSTITCNVLYVFECPSFIQLYTRRKRLLKGGEKVYRDQINSSYTSEESTHESDGKVVVHKHTPVFPLKARFCPWWSHATTTASSRLPLIFCPCVVHGIGALVHSQHTWHMCESAKAACTAHGLLSW